MILNFLDTPFMENKPATEKSCCGNQCKCKEKTAGIHKDNSKKFIQIKPEFGSFFLSKIPRQNRPFSTPKSYQNSINYNKYDWLWFFAGLALFAGVLILFYVL